MSNNAGSLSAVWMSDQPVDEARVSSTVETVLDHDRAARERDRRIRVVMLAALVLLLPLLLWCAAHGVTPLIRAAYALMAMGSAVIVCAEWIYLQWSRQALPGPADARSQLQRTAFVLARQATLLKTAPLWTSPVFVGAMLIGTWLFQARTHTEAFVVWTIVVAGWLVAAVKTRSVSAILDRQRRQMDQLLSEFQ